MIMLYFRKLFIIKNQNSINCLNDDLGGLIGLKDWRLKIQ